MTSLDRLAADARAVSRSPLGATYRLQMHAGFALSDARSVLGYLAALGVTHVYTSSLWTAKPGSTHGYDVIDHGRLNLELGTDEELAGFAADLRARGMGLLLDVVPNHMSVGGPNAWWRDVLEHGRSSRYAEHFDIAWDEHPRAPLRGKVLLPILGEQYGRAVDGGTFRVEYEGGAFWLRVYESRLPVGPRTYAQLLAPVVAALAPDDPAENEARSVLTAVKNLPTRDEPEKGEERASETQAIKRRLAALTDRHPAFAEALAARAAAVTASPEELDKLIESQVYRPCYWRVASDEINYRRFFDVNDLAALATERETVFADIHRLVFQWLADGTVTGLRIDHVDGLFDPKKYLDRLQSGYLLARAEHLLATRPEDYPELSWIDARPILAERFAATADRPLTVVIEKILAGREQLPEGWATDGTTGYEFAVTVGGLFVDADGEPPLTAAYDAFSGRDDTFADVSYDCKFLVLQSSLTSELHVLAGHLDRVAQAGRWSRDFTLNGLRHALREVLACFPAYRSYIAETVADPDRYLVNRATRLAARRNPSLGPEVFAFIRDTLLLRDPPDGSASVEYRAAQVRFAGKFQQLTAPVTAKGVEDTALYRFNRLLALNEVGGNPGRFAVPPPDLHTFLRMRPAGGLSPLSTHDTKRSEDVRARLAVLSEMAAEFGNRAQRWAEMNRRHKPDVEDGFLAPDGNEEWFIYQTLLGAWPLEGNSPEFVRRVTEYMTKALREAKENSSWLNPNTGYDEAVCEFVRRILDPEKSDEFLADFEPFQKVISRFGMLNSLAQTLIRCTAPGVPDTYQGTEAWDFSLVDPDNRRPVDFGTLAAKLASLDDATEPLPLARELAANPDDGRIKLHVVSRALRFRRDRANLFTHGSYEPVTVVGEKADCAFAYLRQLDGQAVLVVVPRLVTRIATLQGPLAVTGGWGDTHLQLPETLASGRWSDLFTGRRTPTAGPLPVSGLLADFPVACLTTDA